MHFAAQGLSEPGSLDDGTQDELMRVLPRHWAAGETEARRKAGTHPRSSGATPALSTARTIRGSARGCPDAPHPSRDSPSLGGLPPTAPPEPSVAGRGPPLCLLGPCQPEVPGETERSASKPKTRPPPQGERSRRQHRSAGGKVTRGSREEGRSSRQGCRIHAPGRTL